VKTIAAIRVFGLTPRVEMLAHWFRPRSTVDPVTRRWIDDKLEWLDEQFADEQPDPATILPTAEFFPDRFDRSDDTVRALVHRVCGYMGVDPDAINVQLFDKPPRPLYLVDEENRAVPTTPAGTYHRGERHFVIRLERGQADEPMHLVGTVAHELAHVRLMGEGRVTGDEFDNELLTDLTVVRHGLGIFLANVPRHWDSQNSTWPGTDVPMPRYMTTPMYGYALARLAIAREGGRPAWRRRLNPGVRAEFKSAVRFLNSSRA
jgi:hypothetical protein